MRFAALALVLALGCDEAVATDAGAVADASSPLDAGARVDAGASPSRCTTFLGGEEAGTVDEPALDELSGLAASRAHAGVLYAHNDSGGAARVFMLGLDGTPRGYVDLRGASAYDYEDIAVGPGPDGAPWVYVGDIGDNAARTGMGAARATVTIYRFPEASVAPDTTASVDAEAISIRYPIAPHDCESLAVTADGDLLMLTKEDAPRSELFVARAPLGADVTLERIADLAIAPGSRNATAMDLSPRGDGLLVRSYNRVHLFVRQPGEDWADVVTRAPLAAPARPETQGESVAWSADGRGYYTASEGVGPPLHFFAATPGCEPL